MSKPVRPVIRLCFPDATAAQEAERYIEYIEDENALLREELAVCAGFPSAAELDGYLAGLRGGADE